MLFREIVNIGQTWYKINVVLHKALGVSALSCGTVLFLKTKGGIFTRGRNQVALLIGLAPVLECLTVEKGCPDPGETLQGKLNPILKDFCMSRALRQNYTLFNLSYISGKVSSLCSLYLGAECQSYLLCRHKKAFCLSQTAAATSWGQMSQHAAGHQSFVHTSFYAWSKPLVTLKLFI